MEIPPNPSRREHFDTGLLWMFVVIALLVAFFAAALYAIVTNEYKEDDRQVRQYGNLSCVYNVTRDKIESCAEVSR